MQKYFFFVAVGVAVAGKSIITKTFLISMPVVVRACSGFQNYLSALRTSWKNVFPKQHQKKKKTKKNVKEKNWKTKQGKSVFHGYMKYI